MTVPAAGPHGGDGPAVAAALGVDPASVLDLSVSLNPFAPGVRTLAVGHLDALGWYPDPQRATAALAAAIGVEAERIVLTNGGSEAIALVAAELGPGWVDEPDFSLYRRHLPAVHSGAPVWRSNPRNPTGELAPPDTTAGSGTRRSTLWQQARGRAATPAPSSSGRSRRCSPVPGCGSATSSLPTRASPTVSAPASPGGR